VLSLVEHFYSIQGEGPFSGVPALFFRFAGCNLACPGFGVQTRSPRTGEMLTGCDTIRAVATAHFADTYQKILGAQELIKILDSYDFSAFCAPAGQNFITPNFPVPNSSEQNLNPHQISSTPAAPNPAKSVPNLPIIVITGGEPLLHARDTIFTAFIAELLACGHQVHFETNGTIAPPFETHPVYRDCIYAISPKLSDAGNAKPPSLAAIQSIASHARMAFLKFVYSPRTPESELHAIAKAAGCPVYCMPLGATRRELSRHDEACLKFCLKNGYNYTDRVHIRIFDDKDGV